MKIDKFDFEEFTDLTEQEVIEFKAWYKNKIKENKELFEQVKTFQVFPDGDYMSFNLHLKDGGVKEINDVSVPEFMGGNHADGGSIGIDIETGKIIGWEKITKEMIYDQLFGHFEEYDDDYFYQNPIDEFITIKEREDAKRIASEDEVHYETGSVDDF